jgi:hypothetical protein
VWRLHSEGAHSTYLEVKRSRRLQSQRWGSIFGGVELIWDSTGAAGSQCRGVQPSTLYVLRVNVTGESSPVCLPDVVPWAAAGRWLWDAPRGLGIRQRWRRAFES